MEDLYDVLDGADKFCSEKVEITLSNLVLEMNNQTGSLRSSAEIVGVKVIK